MQLSMEQIEELAGDSRSIASARYLIALKFWEEVGFSAEMMWGRCRGSSVYQVKIDLKNLGSSCNCPSRKYPCKHSIGLLLLAAHNIEAIPDGTPPEWADTWISRRREKQEQKIGKESQPSKPVDTKAQQKRAGKREKKVAGGVEQLSLWMNDLIRSGLASVEGKPAAFWEDQAKRLVDAQASGLANRVRGLSHIPGSSPNWPDRLASELGRIKLLSHAFERLEELDPELQSDVRQLIGWNVSSAELDAICQSDDSDRVVEDEWFFYGQELIEDTLNTGRAGLRSQRSWAVGKESKQHALFLQFAPGSQGFSETIVAGTRQRAKVVFYPGAAKQRAKFVERAGQPRPINESLPGSPTINDFLDAYAEQLGQQPWLTTKGCVLSNVTVSIQDDKWYAVDSEGNALRLQSPDWKLLAVTGAEPCDLAGEWNGYTLRVLGAVTVHPARPNGDDRYFYGLSS